MRRIWALILVLCLAAGCLSFAAGEQAEDESAVHGVDAVVVLDMTKSMVDEDGRKGNDHYGYRLDATAMLIGMLDMNGSRVAIVPFAGQPDSVTELTAVSSMEERSALISKIRRLTEKPNTNIGAALMRANQILTERADKTNQPMIVLLTDGENSINGNVQVTPSYRWDPESGTIQDQGRESYTTQTANEVTREAVECARTLGYPIYTVALNTDPAEQPRGGMSLNSISFETGVTIGAQRANQDTVDKLPEFFANILADKIGSSVQVTMRPRQVEGKLYEVTIPILNRSIQETNIIIPVRNSTNQATIRRSKSAIDHRTIRVFNGSQEQTAPTVTVMYEGGFFSMVKIRRPDSAGSWKLQFESEEDPTSISFNLLYNYDIKLSAGVSNAAGSQDFYKTDTLRVKAYFVEGDGSASTDSDLYKDHTADVGEEYSSWAKITAVCSLYRTDERGEISGDALLSQEMAANDILNLFEQDLDLSQASPRLSSGAYLLRINADGAGLTRQVDIPLTLKNHAPYAAQPYEETIHVNPVDSEERWNVRTSSGALLKLANEIVTDEDGDQMDYELRAEGNESDQAAVLEMDGESIRYTTREANERVRGGDAVYTLYFTDREIERPESVRLTLHIISDVDELLEGYSPEITTLDPEGSGADAESFLKNSPIRVAVGLKNNRGEYAGEELMEKLTASLKILKDGAPWDEVEMTRSGNLLEYTLEDTGNEAAEWTFTAAVKYFAPIDKKVTVANSGAPAPASAKDLLIRTDGAGVPGFLRSLIGKETPAEDSSLRIDSRNLFTDADNDHLTYGAPVISAPNSGRELTSLKAEPVSGEDQVYMIRVRERKTSLFSYSYGAEVKVTATDGDGQTGTWIRRIQVEDLYYKMMTFLVMILIAIVILVILILIIHQIRKPKFPRLNMTIREEPSYYETDSETLSPVKTPTNVNRVGVDADMAAKHNISMELLQNTVIKPLRSISSVGVRYKKAVSGHEVMLDDVRMKPKKWYIWRVGQELSIRSASGEGLIAIKLEDRTDLPDEDDLREFGDDSNWETSDQTAQTPRAGKKRSHRVEKRQSAPTAENTQSGGGNDDFDF